MDLEKQIDAVLKGTSRKPLKRHVMEHFGGKRAVFDTLEEAVLPRYGLCRLDRDKLGTRTRYYVRLGIDSQDNAMKGGMPHKTLAAARKTWNEMLSRQG